MSQTVRVFYIFMAVAIALVTALVFLGGLGVASAAEPSEVDLSVSIGAPEHIAPGSNYIVNVAYENEGTSASPEDTWVAVTLPEGVQFVLAVDRGGASLPPDSVVGNLLTWQVGSLPAGSCCQHILITLLVDENLPEEQALTFSFGAL